MPAPRHVIEKFGSAWIRPGNRQQRPFVLSVVPNACGCAATRLSGAQLPRAARCRAAPSGREPDDDGAPLPVRRARPGPRGATGARVEWMRRELGTQMRVGRGGVSNEVLENSTQRRGQSPTQQWRARRWRSTAARSRRSVIAFPTSTSYALRPACRTGARVRTRLRCWLMARREGAEARRLLRRRAYGAASLEDAHQLPEHRAQSAVAVVICDDVAARRRRPSCSRRGPPLVY